MFFSEISKGVHAERTVVFGAMRNCQLTFPRNERLLVERSVFYNDLFAFDMERRRWFRLALKKSVKKVRDKGKGKQGGGGSAQVRGREAFFVLFV